MCDKPKCACGSGWGYIKLEIRMTRNFAIKKLRYNKKDYDRYKKYFVYCCGCQKVLCRYDELFFKRERAPYGGQYYSIQNGEVVSDLDLCDWLNNLRWNEYNYFRLFEEALLELIERKKEKWVK